MSEPGPDKVALAAWLRGLCALPPGAAVLDAGCGDGRDLIRIGRGLGPGARLVGADLSRGPLGRARAGAAGDARFAFPVADLARPWPFAGASFDLAYSNNVLECLTDKAAFLRETHRALKPGGQVVCAHWDHDSHTVDGVDKALVRRVVAAFSDWQQGWMADADGWMGRRLWRTFQRSGLFRGEVRAYVLTNTQFAPPYYGHKHITGALPALARRGLIGQSECDRFLGAVSDLAARDEYFYSVTLYAYVGEKR